VSPKKPAPTIESGASYFNSYSGGRAGPANIQSSSEFEKLFYEHNGRLIHKWHHYLWAYDEMLEPYKAGSPAGGALKFLEIGVSEGGSLELWRKYFGPDARIFGIDINPKCASLDRPELPVRIGSQGSPEFLNRVVAEMGGVDVVLDDGSHLGRHQLVSFSALFPLLPDGGLYIVEDTHTSYWKEWEGAFRRPDTMVETGKSLVDDIHGWYHSGKPIVYGRAKEEIGSITFYDSIVAIKKRKRGIPRHFVVGSE
jgi:cephalosporin hydroxylase